MVAFSRITEFRFSAVFTHIVTGHGRPHLSRGYARLVSASIMIESVVASNAGYSVVSDQPGRTVRDDANAKLALRANPGAVRHQTLNQLPKLPFTSPPTIVITARQFTAHPWKGQFRLLLVNLLQSIVHL